MAEHGTINITIRADDRGFRYPVLRALAEQQIDAPFAKDIIRLLDELEGAAPRAEGLPSVEALALAMAACGISDGDGDPMPDVAAAILTRLGAAPRAEGLDVQVLRTALLGALADIKWWTYFGKDDSRPPQRTFDDPWTEALAEDLAKFTARRLRDE